MRCAQQVISYWYYEDCSPWRIQPFDLCVNRSLWLMWHSNAKILMVHSRFDRLLGIEAEILPFMVCTIDYENVHQLLFSVFMDRSAHHDVSNNWPWQWSDAVMHQSFYVRKRSSVLHGYKHADTHHISNDNRLLWTAKQSHRELLRAASFCIRISSFWCSLSKYESEALWVYFTTQLNVCVQSLLTLSIADVLSQEYTQWR